MLYNLLIEKGVYCIYTHINLQNKTQNSIGVCLFSLASLCIKAADMLCLVLSHVHVLDGKLHVTPV